MDKIENSWSRNYKKTENDTANTYNMTPQEITDNINTKGSSIYEDSIIKGFLKYTNFTGFLLTRVIKELEGVSLEDFKNRTGGSQFLNMEPTEYGTAETKAIHLDLVFEYDHQDVLRLRVDMEPQSSQKAFSIKNEKSYSLIARAMYYAGVLLATELQPEEEYHNIRKVYSIWICYKKPVPGVDEPVIRYSMKPEKEYYYNTLKNGKRETIYSNRHKFDDGDLISVILISVPAIEEVVKNPHKYINGNGNVKFADTYNFDTLSELYTLLSDKVSTKERKVFLEEKHIEERGERSMDFFEQAVMEAEKAKEDARLAKEDARLAKEDARLAKEKAKIDVEIVERFTEVLSIVKLVSKKREKGKTYNIIKEELELEDENFLEDVMTIIKENPGCSPKELSAIYLDRV